MPRTDFPTPPSPKTRLILSLGFGLIVLCSALGLDYFQWKEGEKSYLLFLWGKTPIQEKTLALDNLILNSLTAVGIRPDLSTRKIDAMGRTQFSISMAHADYKNTESPLEEELQKARIFIRINQKTENNFIIFLWELQDGEEEKKASILFLCPKDIVASPEKSNFVPSKNKVALIVDDMGYSLETLRRIKDLGLSLTIAILPYSPWAKETAQMAQQNNMEVILHLPLESLNDYDSNSSTEGLIHSRMLKSDVLETLETNLAQVPFIKGVNNHMGSKITAERDTMSLIFERLKKDNLYFIDSVTSGRSIAYKLAREMSISSAFRHVFLDSETEEKFILNQLIQLLRLAQKQGVAVGICHPFDTTLKVLSDNLELFKEFNCETVFASEIVK
ncbi:divergent polysaccharide deacetylase family protein [Acidobacteriota bacterium]